MGASEPAAGDTISRETRLTHLNGASGKFMAQNSVLVCTVWRRRRDDRCVKN